MPFLQIKRDTIYLAIDNNPKPIRPLLVEALGKWVHMISGCVQITPPPDNKKKELRRFTMVDADFSRWFKENPDPLWDLLDQNDKFNRDGKRQDFAVRPQHILPVWSYMDNDVKVVKQGNQFFEEMVKYYDGGGKVVDCDWLCWTEGSGRTKQYQTSRQDKSQFNPPIDPNLIGQKIQAVMKQALEDLRPFTTEADMLKYIYGQTAEEATSFPHGANAPAQLPPAQRAQNMPSYTPGGATQTILGNPPISVPQPWVAPQAAPAPAAAPTPWVAPQSWAPSPAQPQPQAQQPQAQPQPQPTWAPPVQPQAWAPPSTQPQAQPQPQAWAPPQSQAWTPPQTPIQQPLWTPPKVEVPNAPVSSAPVFAPPQASAGQPQAPAGQPQAPAGQPQAPAGQPQAPTDQSLAMFVPMTTGKHAGKPLGWIKDNDPSYLTFLKGNKKELAPMIEAFLGGSPAPAQASAPAQAPQAASADADAELMRSRLVKDLNQKLMSLPEFQGPGITNMGPFLQQVIGTANFSSAPLDQLQILMGAVDVKLGAARAQ